MDFRTVLDVGSGEGEHAAEFRTYGKAVTTVDYRPPADHVGDFEDMRIGRFDCVWASHVLEHHPNPGLFLKACFRHLNNNGILAVTVPPMKPEIVGGHLTVWNAGLLVYNLVMAGFDCSKAQVKTYGYNVSVIVRKRAACLAGVVRDFGDIETLARYFPVPIKHGDSGVWEEVNW